jgi:hypothetical protein
MPSTLSDVTVVVVPREKYSRAHPVLATLERAEPAPGRVVWVDEGRAPGSYRRWMHTRAAGSELVHITLAHRAGANECRMRGFEATSTPFVLFLDNDAHLTPGSLEAMANCMRETGASFVSPLILELDGRVHHAGGDTAIVDDADGRRLVEHLRLQGRPPASADPPLVRSRTSALEMHAVMVRAESLVAAGGLDTELSSSLDCADLGLRLRDRHGGGWLEPSAVATYDSTAPHPSDLSLYLGRWCRATVEHDISRFAASWQIDTHDPRLDDHRVFLRTRRMRVIRYLRGGTRRLFGAPTAGRVEDAAEPVLDALAKARLPA